MENGIRIMDLKKLNSTNQATTHKSALVVVEFLGGPVDGLLESHIAGHPLDELVGLRRDDQAHGSKLIALYGLSREAQGCRYRFLRYLI